MRKWSLDLEAVKSPDMVPPLLRAAAEQYRDDASELDNAWQDRRAGNPWRKIARILDSAADQIDRMLEAR